MHLSHGKSFICQMKPGCGPWCVVVPSRCVTRAAYGSHWAHEVPRKHWVSFSFFKYLRRRVMVMLQLWPHDMRLIHTRLTVSCVTQHVLLNTLVSWGNDRMCRHIPVPFLNIANQGLDETSLDLGPARSTSRKGAQMITGGCQMVQCKHVPQCYNLACQHGM